jgi:hypothetical protein
MNRNPGITTGVTAGIIVLALLFIIWSNWSSSSVGGATGGKSYYTEDDGVTYFADDNTKIPPFDHNGKQAVRAYVFQCKGGKPFVQYLERYTPDAKTKLEANRTKKTPDIGLLEGINFEGLEVKKAKAPADKWIKQSSPAYAQIVQPKCPDGDASQIISVMPD